MKIYHLYPTASGFTTQSVAYQGIFYGVCAENIKQAYAFAYKRVWAAGPDNPLGLVEIYERGGPEEGWSRLWDGCRAHQFHLEHGAGKRATVALMWQHVAGHKA